ncbi:hypothetical protein AMS68_005245 [Peltaster fructicola]|uniref:Uncharacterized protein n=1 Tax=Peltaster fructicola TaxID=286661 RepID=A0A6H0XYQ0_9PEZI|nr:hypothetical protein AMS68_005245 [Peltaster fructicola]
MSLRLVVFGLAILLCVHGAAGDLLQYRGFFKNEEYQYYLTESTDLAARFNATGSTSKSRYIHILVACMLEHMDELDKTQIAVANVILGVLPAILIFASSTCIELGLLAQRRPILTTLLAAASPGLSPLRRGDYYSEAQFLLTQPRCKADDKAGDKAGDRPGDNPGDNPGSEAAGEATKHIQPSTSIMGVVVSILEYLLALAAIVNIIHNTWQLSRRTVCAYSPESAIQPILWATLALVAHFFEMFVMWLRVECSERSDSPPPNCVTWLRIDCSKHSDSLPSNHPQVTHEQQDVSKGMSASVISHQPKVGIRKRVRAWADWLWSKELRVCSLHEEVTYTFRCETLMSRFSSWVCNKLIIVYIIWGTFFFSSILFVKPTDALLISLRYLASVVVSRLILQYELDGLSLKAHIPDWWQG